MFYFPKMLGYLLEVSRRFPEENFSSNTSQKSGYKQIYKQMSDFVQTRIQPFI